MKGHVPEFNESLLLRRRDEINDLGVRVHFIGIEGDPRVPVRVQRRMEETEALTAGNTRMNMVFAFNYGSRAEIATAARRLAAAVAAGEIDPGTVDEAAVAAHLYLPEMPDPDLVIRTSGELRISNFLLWQSAYAEFVFADALWPDFGKAEFLAALEEYSRRDRRFGLTGDPPGGASPEGG